MTDPERGEIERLRGLLAEIAARGPLAGDRDYDYCWFCGADRRYGSGTRFDDGDPSAHEPGCLWVQILPFQADGEQWRRT